MSHCSLHATQIPTVVFKVLPDWYLCTTPNSSQPTPIFIPYISASQDFLFLQNPRIACTLRPFVLTGLLGVLYTPIFVWVLFFSYRSQLQCFLLKESFPNHSRGKKNPSPYANRHLALIPLHHSSCLFIYLSMADLLPLTSRLHEIRDLICLV